MVVNNKSIPSPKDIQPMVSYVNDPTKTLDNHSPFPDYDLMLDPDMSSNFILDLHQTPTGQFRTNYISTCRCTMEDFEDRCCFLQAMCKHCGNDAKHDPVIAYHIVYACPPGTLLTNADVHLFGRQNLEALGPRPSILCSHIEPVKDPHTGILRGVYKHDHALVCAYPDSDSLGSSKLDPGSYAKKSPGNQR